MDETDARFWGLAITSEAEEWADRVAARMWLDAVKRRPLMLLMPTSMRLQMVSSIAAGALAALADLWARDLVDADKMWEIVRTQRDTDEEQGGTT